MSFVCRFRICFYDPATARVISYESVIFLSHWLQRPELEEMRLIVD